MTCCDSEAKAKRIWLVQRAAQWGRMGKWTERRKLAKCADSVSVSVRQSKSLFVVLCSPAVHRLRSGPTGAARS